MTDRETLSFEQTQAIECAHIMLSLSHTTPVPVMSAAAATTRQPRSRLVPTQINSPFPVTYINPAYYTLPYCNTNAVIYQRPQRQREPKRINVY